MYFFWFMTQVTKTVNQYPGCGHKLALTKIRITIIKNYTWYIYSYGSGHESHPLLLKNWDSGLISIGYLRVIIYECDKSYNMMVFLYTVICWWIYSIFAFFLTNILFNSLYMINRRQIKLATQLLHDLMALYVLNEYGNYHCRNKK